MQELEKIQEKILNDKDFRMELASQDYYWFFHIYFPHYIKYPTGKFHKRIYALLQNWALKFLEIIAFRGSAKSTLAMLGLPIWAVVTGKAKFPIIISDTFPQAKSHIYNLKSELDNNELLKADWGPFELQDEWTATEIVLPKYGARIVAKSTGQKIRGLRHKQYRPDLIVVDDIENQEMVRTKEQRDKTYRWFLGDVLPGGDKETRYILIGNLLNKDSIMSRIKKQIEEGIRKGVVKEFPFFDEKGEPQWKEKFKTKEVVEEEKAKYDNRTWQREFLLRLIPEEGQEVKDEWIKHYKTLPDDTPMNQGTAVDLAISKKQTADFTAMVSGKLFIIDDKPKIYIMPNPVNKRLSGKETDDEAKTVSLALGNGTLTSLWVEDVAYQKRAIEEMVEAGLPAEGITVSTDKRARLRLAAKYIENGTVVFPEKGCEDLILQLTGFGIEKHDDLCDACVHLIMKLMSSYTEGPLMTII